MISSNQLFVTSNDLHLAKTNGVQLYKSLCMWCILRVATAIGIIHFLLFKEAVQLHLLN